MRESLSVENFRCFEKLEVSRLAKINLLVGANNVGKSSILEAVFIHSGLDNAALPFRANALRGIQQYSSNTEDMFGSFFYKSQIDRQILIHSTEKTTWEETGQLTTAVETNLEVR